MRNLMWFAIFATIGLMVIKGLINPGLESFANCEKSGGIPTFQENHPQGWVCKKGL